MPSITPPDVCAVLFDYGQVLSLPADPTAWATLRSLTGASEESLHHSYWQHRDEYDRGGLTSEAYWQTLSQELGFTLDDDKLTVLRAADIEVWGGQNEPMVEWAHRLQQSGMRTGILSNIGDAMESGLRAKHAWIADFTHCVWSHQYKIIKPAAAIYKYAIDGLGRPAANILFIDDREKNVQGAIAAGLQAIQYTTHAEFLRTMRERGYGSLLDIS
ncbi:MAG TPA: HAD family phosphatase [Acidobacteriaceae bacterium]